MSDGGAPGGPEDDRIDLMKREIDALQVQVMKDRGPWYRQVPVVIPLVVSVMALSLAMITTVIGEERVTRQEKHDARVELRELVQRLTALPRENAQFLETYKSNADALTQAASTLNTEQIVLAQQAADVIEELGGSVTPSEYTAVGYALFLAGDAGASLRLLERGLSATVALDPVGRSALLRQAAFAHFAAGDWSEGRRRFQQALDLSRSAGVALSSRQANAAFTEASWAQTELGAGQCAVAAAHVARAEGHVQVAGAVSPSLRVQIATVRGRVSAHCPAPGG